MQDSLYRAFLETPLAELADHGLPLSTIHTLEGRFGLYVRDLMWVTDDQVVVIENVGRTRLKQLKHALRALKESKS